jgi:hypothetical protein
MAKTTAPKYDAFELAIRQMSIQQLRKIGVLYNKSLTDCETRDDFVHRLSLNMKPAERMAAMRDFILAGQTSMTIYTLDLPDGNEGSIFEPDFKGTASREPTIVTVGKDDEIIAERAAVAMEIFGTPRRAVRPKCGTFAPNLR